MKRPASIYIFCFFLLMAGSCSVNSAKIDNDLKKYFDARNGEGCFTMMDNSTGKVTVYNLEMDTTRVSPGSTFEIVHSLIGLETGKIRDEKMIIPWDGVRRSDPSWNKDLNMEQAFKANALPYFQEISRRVGKDTIEDGVDSLNYGNKNISGPVDSFWLNNQLKISPDEQAGLMKRLYFDQLPFRKSVQQSVRDVMLREDNTAYKLSYKTGAGIDETNNSIGWLVGWIEENRHVYFFATLVRSKDRNTDMKPVSIGITKDVLKHYVFFEGKK